MLLFLSEQAAPDECGGQRLDRCIQAMAQGDRSALEALYRQTSPSIYGFALSICQNVQDAEDVLQDTYLQALKAAGSYHSQGKPMAWLLTIARNLARMRLRERKKTVSPAPDEWRSILDQRSAVTPEDRLILEAMLDTLSPQEQQIVVLHAVTGLKHREIASLLELPLPTVLSKYSRALKKLRLVMKEDN